MPRALLSTPGCYRLFSYIFFEEVLFVSHINLPGQAPDLPYRVLAQGPLDFYPLKTLDAIWAVLEAF